MQPEHSSVFENIQSQATEQISSLTSQHGRQPHHQEPSLLISSDAARTGSDSGPTGPERLPADIDAVDTDLVLQRQSTAEETTGVKRPSPPPRDRITEYENMMSTPSPKKQLDGPAFAVIKKSPKTGEHKDFAAKLPNELWTHALSHLSPDDLSAVSLVSRRFHNLVTTPYAWKVAFARYFPGHDSLKDTAHTEAGQDEQEALRSEKRSFTRLTALASWRSEYIMRTRLLRSLTRGKPMEVITNSRTGQTTSISPLTNYSSGLLTTVNHLHATFGTELNKHYPRFIHGGDDFGGASISDPSLQKIDNWGLSDPTFFPQFADVYPGDAQWGLGAGDIVGVPNTMDVSQPYGMLYGIGAPGGSVYFRSVEEQRGRFVAMLPELSLPEVGAARPLPNQSITSVWIAKSLTFSSMSEGLIGFMAGASSGILSAFSLGSHGGRDQRLGRGELTARWVLSPGVPIIAIAADDQFSMKRQAQNRIWAVALNALGELFYLTKFPTRPGPRHVKNLGDEAREELAWATGRTVYWNIVEPSRRTARADPYNDAEVDGSYSPRSSWNGMCLTREQVAAETGEIETFMRMQPIDFRNLCTGWDMQRRLEVDFANDDGNFAGESIVVFQCGLGEEGEVLAIERFTRSKVAAKEALTTPGLTETSEQGSLASIEERPSLFGGITIPTDQQPAPTRPTHLDRPRSYSRASSNSSPERTELVEEWRTSHFSFDGLKSVQLSVTAIDSSTYATMSQSEDPTLSFSGRSTASSPFASPFSNDFQPTCLADIPGQRSRLVAAGTKTGVVIIWDIRASISKNTELINTVDPVRIIYTDSPEISSLALSALYLVHGGNDGLVQAWDPLASSQQPVRTLHSRFTSRARRRLVQAQASAQGVGINNFAAGAICLDPDPTILRGMMSLGTHLRYWSYSSLGADQYKSRKRRLRRSQERGSNNVNRVTASGRAARIEHFIADERHELEREQRHRRKEADRLAGRFGVDLLGSEEEALAYAAMLSEESHRDDEVRRTSEAASRVDTPSLSTSMLSSVSTPPASVIGAQASSPRVKEDSELDAEIAEAIRLSLQESSSTPLTQASTIPETNVWDIPIRYGKTKKKSPTRSQRGSPEQRSGRASAAAGASNQAEMDDLELALQLSLAEEQSQREMEGVAEEYPSLNSGKKGKGRM